MDFRAPEAGLPLDKEMMMVVSVHQALVGKYGARPIALKFLLDSQRSDGVDGHFEAEYELFSGTNIRLNIKRVKGEMVVKVMKGRGQVNYSVNIDKCVNDDLMPIQSKELDDLVSRWVNE